MDALWGARRGAETAAAANRFCAARNPASANLSDTVVARQIGTLRRALYASPAYARSRGLPEKPEDLHAHTLVTNSAVTMLNEWPFRVEGETWTFNAQGQWRANDTNMAATMVLQGLGIGRLATLVGDALLQQGLLVPALAGFAGLRPVPVHAVTTGARHRLPKIKARLDYWTEWFAR